MSPSRAAVPRDGYDNFGAEKIIRNHIWKDTLAPNETSLRVTLADPSYINRRPSGIYDYEHCFVVGPSSFTVRATVDWRSAPDGRPVGVKNAFIVKGSVTGPLRMFL